MSKKYSLWEEKGEQLELLIRQIFNLPDISNRHWQLDFPALVAAFRLREPKSLTALKSSDYQLLVRAHAELARANSSEFDTISLEEKIEFDFRACRWNAAIHLGKTRNPTAMGPLTETLENDECPTVREYAAKALEELSDDRGEEALRKALLKDQSIGVRRSAAHALDWFCLERARSFLKIGDFKAAHDQALRILNSESAIKCEHGLSGFTDLQCEAIDVLSAIGSSNMIEPLVAVIKDSQTYINVREKAIETLANITDGRADEAVLTAGECDSHLKTYSIQAVFKAKKSRERKWWKFWVVL